VAFVVLLCYVIVRCLLIPNLPSSLRSIVYIIVNVYIIANLKSSQEIIKLLEKRTRWVNRLSLMFSNRLVRQAHFKMIVKIIQ
jgi:hypothetical protein